MTRVYWSMAVRCARRSPDGELRMSRLWNAEVIPWAMKAIMPELSLRVPFVFVHKRHGLDNGR